MSLPDLEHPAVCQTVPLDVTLNVADRLADLRRWRDEWRSQDQHLRQLIEALDPQRHADVLRGSQLAGLRRQLSLQIVQKPIFLNPETVRQAGLQRLRQHLARQYARLCVEDRRLWLSNLHFVLTPSLQLLLEKLDAIRHYRSFGQQRCFLLGGVSGAGKSTLLNWYSVNHLPRVQTIRNHVPVVKIDAPVSNRSPKPLFERMLLACGAVALRGSEEHYLQLLEMYFQQCGVEILVVDEVEHIVAPTIRRRLLELSNLTQVPIVCASCNPISWTQGDSEIQGRWNDYFELTQFSGARLDAFLTLLDCLLPFEQDSQLGLREITQPDKSKTAGLAHFVEQWTDGILREIMVLITDACHKALAADLPCLTVDVLQHAWRDIKRTKVVNFLEHTQAKQALSGGGHV